MSETPKNAAVVLSNYLKSLREAANKDYNRELPLFDLFRVSYFGAIVFILGRLLEKRPDILEELEAATKVNQDFINKPL